MGVDEAVSKNEVKTGGGTKEDQKNRERGETSSEGEEREKIGPKHKGKITIESLSQHQRNTTAANGKMEGMCGTGFVREMRKTRPSAGQKPKKKEKQKEQKAVAVKEPDGDGRSVEQMCWDGRGGVENLHSLRGDQIAVNRRAVITVGGGSGGRNGIDLGGSVARNTKSESESKSKSETSTRPAEIQQNRDTQQQKIQSHLCANLTTSTNTKTRFTQEVTTAGSPGFDGADFRSDIDTITS